MKLNSTFLFLLSTFLVVILASSIYEPLRYIKYGLPLLSLLFSLIYSKKELLISRNEANYFLTFTIFYSGVIAFLLIGNILFSSLSDRFIPNAIFILSPILFILFCLPFFKTTEIKEYVFLIFIVNTVVFLLEEGRDLWLVISDLSSLRAALLSSDIPTENSLAFVFGFFVIYFTMEKQSKLLIVIATVLFILCFKRIVIVAVLLCIVVYYLTEFFRIDIVRNRMKWTAFVVVINLLFLKVTHLLISGTFDDFIYEKTGFSTDRFLMGRQTFYEMAFNEVGDFSWFGIGLGKIDDIILFSYGQKMNLHSEILKNYFEFGVILFLVWIILFAYKNLFSNKAAIFFIYINILMLTDNVFIYFDIMFYFYFFVLIYLKKQDSRFHDEGVLR